MFPCIADSNEQHFFCICLVVCRQLHHLNIGQGEKLVLNHTFKRRISQFGDILHYPRKEHAMQDDTFFFSILKNPTGTLYSCEMSMYSDHKLDPHEENHLNKLKR